MKKKTPEKKENWLNLSSFCCQFGSIPVETYPKWIFADRIQIEQLAAVAKAHQNNQTMKLSIWSITRIANYLISMLWNVEPRWAGKTKMILYHQLFFLKRFIQMAARFYVSFITIYAYVCLRAFKCVLSFVICTEVMLPQRLTNYPTFPGTP